MLEDRSTNGSSDQQVGDSSVKKEDIVKQTREMLGALLGCGWSLESILDLSFEQMREVSSCIYAHKLQMIEIVAEPIAGAFGAKKKGKKITQTQADLKKTGLSKEERDKILMSKIRGLGFNT